ncbi:hypothetical protein K437DRAFT_92302 [Tilletiaria anomala UBC 951]|uniref:Uncharacterized protein n=1 Tax=Tilletiaria anomala (strain ATCC 24038 / CBS 436.72 / UBC 951) TaxID=1037660 RepID=A0A066W219_TILAU|nr:uncharacterized protein K437DRAFT_92302 [Tilletiaria anomala UBC 951]KDN47761.1 hypothetical protein K437DRAFT_92302 [Tilletiaria anomala UBC 951]
MKAFKSLGRKSSASERDAKSSREQLRNVTASASSSFPVPPATRPAISAAGSSTKASSPLAAAGTTSSSARLGAAASKAGLHRGGGAATSGVSDLPALPNGHPATLGQAQMSSSGAQRQQIPAQQQPETASMSQLRFSGFNFDSLIPMLGADGHQQLTRGTGGPYGIATAAPPSPSSSSPVGCSNGVVISAGGSGPGQGLGSGIIAPLQRSASGSGADTIRAASPSPSPWSAASPFSTPRGAYPPVAAHMQPPSLRATSPTPPTSNSHLQQNTTAQGLGIGASNADWVMPGTREIHCVVPAPSVQPHAAMMSPPDAQAQVLTHAQAQVQTQAKAEAAAHAKEWGNGRSEGEQQLRQQAQEQVNSSAQAQASGAVKSQASVPTAVSTKSGPPKLEDAKPPQAASSAAFPTPHQTNSAATDVQSPVAGLAPTSTLSTNPGQIKSNKECAPALPLPQSQLMAPASKDAMRVSSSGDLHAAQRANDAAIPPQQLRAASTSITDLVNGSDNNSSQGVANGTAGEERRLRSMSKAAKPADKRSASASMASSKSRAKAGKAEKSSRDTTASGAHDVSMSSEQSMSSLSQPHRQRTTSASSSAAGTLNETKEKDEKKKRRNSLVVAAAKLFGRRKSFNDLSGAATAEPVPALPQGLAIANLRGTEEGEKAQGQAFVHASAQVAGANSAQSPLLQSSSAERPQQPPGILQMPASSTLSSATSNPQDQTSLAGALAGASLAARHSLTQKKNANMLPLATTTSVQAEHAKRLSALPPAASSAQFSSPSIPAQSTSQVNKGMSTQPPAVNPTTTPSSSIAMLSTALIPLQRSPKRMSTVLPVAIPDTQALNGRASAPSSPATDMTQQGRASDCRGETKQEQKEELKEEGEEKIPTKKRLSLFSRTGLPGTLGAVSLVPGPVQMVASSPGDDAKYGISETSTQANFNFPHPPELMPNESLQTVVAHDSDASETSNFASKDGSSAYTEPETNSGSETMPETPGDVPMSRFKPNIKDAPVVAVPLYSQMRSPQQGIPSPQAASPMMASPSSVGSPAFTMSPHLRSTPNSPTPAPSNAQVFPMQTVTPKSKYSSVALEGLSSEQMYALRRQGFFTAGKADLSKVPLRKRTVIERRRYDVPVHSATKLPDEAVWVRDEHVAYSDLPLLVWSPAAPRIIANLLGHMEVGDVKSMRQCCRGIRGSLDEGIGRELVLQRFLGEVGYRRWKSHKSMASNAELPTEPIHLTFADVEGFVVGHDLTGEYKQVAQEYIKNKDQLDPRIPQLARASTRAYNRVLARLRLQPGFRYPQAAPAPGSPLVSSWTPPRSPVRSAHRASSLLPSASHSSLLSPATGEQQPQKSSMSRANSYYPSHSDPSLACETQAMLSRRPNPVRSSPELSLANSFSSPPALVRPSLPCPWKPGRAASFRVWVPCADFQTGWLSDDELTRCEQELFKSGVWKLLRKGDVVWDCALGSQRNEGKYIFDGNFLRDLSYVFDPAGHLPSWLNSFLYPPPHFHNIIASTTAHPVVFLDILPFRNEIFSSLKLLQDNVEMGTYRVNKWLYRATMNVTAGQIVSYEGLESVDEAWHGKVVIEAEGTTEAAKEVIGRCAGPAATPKQKQDLIAAVTEGISESLLLQKPFILNAEGEKLETTTPWAVLRERSRPGLIYISPISAAQAPPIA